MKPRPLATRAFLSYSASAQPMADWLISQFRATPINIEIDPNTNPAIVSDPRWRAMRQARIAAANVMLAVVNEETLESPISRFDLRVSQEMGKPTIPIYTGGVRQQVLPSGLIVVREFEMPHPDPGQFRRIVGAVEMSSGSGPLPGKPSIPSPLDDEPGGGQEQQDEEQTDTDEQS